MSAITVQYVFRAAGVDLVGTLFDINRELEGVDKNATTARKRLNAFSDWAYTQTDALGAAKEWRDYMLEFVTLMDAALQKNKEYAAATKHMWSEMDIASKAAANSIGPSIAKFINNLTIGAVYLNTLFSELISGLGAALAGGLQQWVNLLAGALASAADLTSKAWKGEKIKVSDYADAVKRQMDRTAADVVAGLSRASGAHTKAINAARAAFIRMKGVTGPATGTGGAGLEITVAPALQWQDILFKAELWTEATVQELGNWADGLLAAMTSTQKFAGPVEAATGVSDLSGLLSTLAGPIGALAAGVIGLIQNAPAVAFEILNSIFDIYLNADEWVGELVGKFIPQLIRLLPTMVSGFGVLVPEIALELIAAAPSIASAFIDSLLKAIPALLAQIRAMFADFAGDVSASLNPFKKDGSLGTNLGPDAEVKRILGIRLPSLADEGHITKSGLFMGHAGETVQRTRSTAQGGGGMGGFTVGNVYITAPDPRAVFEQFRWLQGTSGIGLKTTGLV